VLESLLGAIVESLEATVAVVTAPDRRSYWPFLLASFALAFVVLALQLRSPRRALRSLLDRDLWTHRSVRFDIAFIAINALAKATLFIPITLSALTASLLVIEGLIWCFGPMQPTTLLSTTQIVVLYTVCLFVAWDFSRYVLHRLLHEVPALWELHKVHHSAEVLTPFTVYRLHPIESLLYGLRGAVTTGLVTGTFYYCVGSEAVQYTFLGVNAIGLAFNAAGANLRHSHVWLSYPAMLERFLISPAQHQLHHSRDPRDFDVNYGSFLAVWDWLGGSLRLSGHRRTLRFGLSDDALNHDPTGAWSAVFSPLAVLVRAVGLRILVGAPRAAAPAPRAEP